MRTCKSRTVLVENGDGEYRRWKVNIQINKRKVNTIHFETGNQLHD